ncbi:hypothetical protein COO60DRAFT_1646847 [Scenedesmus sp. NREL 46B-D3]|nr:hypothetical protein COO60DRAFT_1646847 [Scenedesmus sp. NREL 46B-D3]
MTTYSIIHDIGIDQKILTDFGSWLKEMNVIGLGVGSLVASNALIIGTSITEAVVLPIVHAIMQRTLPKFQVKQVMLPILTFLVTMAVVFLTMRIFKVSMSRPVDWVRITNIDEIKRAVKVEQQPPPNA